VSGSGIYGGESVLHFGRPMATLRGGVLPSGMSGVGSRQKGKMSLRTRMSHVARISLGGLVNLGGESSSGMSLHLVAFCDSVLSLGKKAGVSLYGDN